MKIKFNSETYKTVRRNFYQQFELEPSNMSDEIIDIVDTEMDLKPKEFIYISTVDTIFVNSMLSWCEKHFGPEWHLTDNRKGKWFARIDLGDPLQKPVYKFYFVKEQDLILFALSW